MIISPVMHSVLPNLYSRLLPVLSVGMLKCDFLWNKTFYLPTFWTMVGMPDVADLWYCNVYLLLNLTNTSFFSVLQVF